MKLSDIQRKQEEMLAKLEARANDGDNEAAQVYLNELRSMTQTIQSWVDKQNANKLEEKPAIKAPTPKSWPKPKTDPDLDPFS